MVHLSVSELSAIMRMLWYTALAICAVYTHTSWVPMTKKLEAQKCARIFFYREK